MAGPLLVGGNARLAQAIARQLPGCRGVVRHGPTGDATVVADYRTIPEATFAGVATVINCVGTPHGDAATLHAVNVAVAVAAATRARVAGCRQFIQIGSLSVYGGATAIDGTTPVRPATAYGRSKAAADDALLALATPAFSVVVLRVPALYGVGAAGKFGRLAQAMATFGAFPLVRPAARRSVLHLDNAAAAVAALAADPTPTGVYLAADHEAFSLPLLAAAVTATTGTRVRLVPLPGWTAALARRAAPAAFASLYADSLIAPAAAMTTPLALPVRLADGLAAMLAAGHRSR